MKDRRALTRGGSDFPFHCVKKVVGPATHVILDFKGLEQLGGIFGELGISFFSSSSMSITMSRSERRGLSKVMTPDLSSRSLAPPNLEESAEKVAPTSEGIPRTAQCRRAAALWIRARAASSSRFILVVLPFAAPTSFR